MEGSLPYSGTPTGNSRNVNIGASWGGGTFNRFFNGLIDEVDIYNRALSAQEIADIYNAGSAGKCPPPPPVCVNPPSGLVSWWPGENNVNDIQSGYHGMLQNGATFTTGKIGQAFSFDGVDDYISVPDNTAWDFGMTDFTIDLWVKFDQIKRSMFIHQQAGSNAGGFEFDFQPSGLVFSRNGIDGGIARAWVPQVNVWYHLAVTRTSGTYKLYVNGSQIGSEQADPLPIADVTGIVRIGSWSDGNYEVDGLIDELDIFNRALSAQEIVDIYNAGSAGKCTNTTPPVCVNPPSGLVSWWPGEDNANDIQSSNHGVLQNGAAFATGKVGQSFSFDGVDDVVRISSVADIEVQQFTIEAWVLAESPGFHNDALGGVIVSKDIGDTSIPPYVSWSLVGPGNTNKFHADIGFTDGSLHFLPSTNSFPFSAFHHVASTWDGSTLKLYVNGQLEGELNLGPKTVSYSGEALTIGEHNILPARRAFDGLIDEVDFYNRALSASEIQSIYNAGSAGKCKCEVTFNSVGPFCANAAAVDLSSSVSPAGGAFSGPGISGTMFDPAAAGAGTHAITYTFTDANNCTKSAGQNIVVNALPNVTFNPVGPFLVTDAPVNLAGAVAPSGGTFSGAGISGTMFNPATAGVGAHAITYTFTDGNNCSNSAGQNITVNAGPPTSKVFVFLANKDVEIDRNGASEGNIHANNDITFKKGSPSTHKGDLTAVDDVTINSNNTIVGNVTAGDRVQRSSSVKVTGVVKEDPSTPVIPLPAPSFTAGGNDASVPANGTLSLAPGTYDDVTVNKNATLNLRSGNYFIDGLDLKDSAKLTIDVAAGAANVNVVAKLSFGKKVVVSITPSGEAGSSQVTFTQLDKARVTIGESAKVLGGLIAVKAEVRLSKNSRFKGAICAEQIVADQGAVFLPHGSLTSLPKKSEVEESESDDSEVTESDGLRITDYVLEQNYPNPFNPETVISFQLPENSAVKLTIYSITGQVVRELVNGEMNAGRHAISWDGRDRGGNIVAAGMYLYRLVARGANGEVVFTQTRRMAFVK